jgi:hypothetical protein
MTAEQCLAVEHSDHYRLSPTGKTFPCTLAGVNLALAEAQFLSIDGPKHTVTVVRGGRRKVIARFFHGRRA